MNTPFDPFRDCLRRKFLLTEDNFASLDHKINWSVISVMLNTAQPGNIHLNVADNIYLKAQEVDLHRNRHRGKHLG